MAGSAFIPVAEARLVDLFQSLEPRTIDRRAFKGGIQQRRTTQRQFGDVIAQLQRIIEQQQRPLNVAVRQQVAQIAAIAGLAELQTKILRALGQPVGALCSCWVSFSSVR